MSFTVTGQVVGLDLISEQHISGRAALYGSQYATGYYRGATATFPAAGTLGGYGSIMGSASLSTQYHYHTQFFVRDGNCVDHPVLVKGKRLPLLEGHQVTCVFITNDHRETLLCAVINQNSQCVYYTATEQAIRDHLDLPTHKSVRRELITPEEYRKELAEHRRKWSHLNPWLILVSVIAFTLAVVGLLLLRQGTGIGIALMCLGLLVTLVAGSFGFFIWLREQSIRNQPTYEVVEVRNREVDDELDRLWAFTQRAIQSRLTP